MNPAGSTKRLYLDIETVPGQAPHILDAIRRDIADEVAEIKAPGNYNDPVKIAEFCAAERSKVEASFADRHHKCGLSGLRGEVLCASWAINEGPVRTRRRMLGTDETFFLLSLFDAIFLDSGEFVTWIGHNVRDFDLRFLYQRAVILGVNPGMELPHDSRAGDIEVFDTMTKWAGWGNRVKLDDLCQALGIPGKEQDGMTGKDVYAYAQAGRYDEIATYCAHDVERVRQAHRRMTFA